MCVSIVVSVWRADGRGSFVGACNTVLFVAAEVGVLDVLKWCSVSPVILLSWNVVVQWKSLLMKGWFVKLWRCGGSWGRWWDGVEVRCCS